MPKINLLPKNVAELIAAGEVVERPASVIKELVENSIDAGATAITVEIKRGGITYMRVTDNGCGIDYADVPTAFLRHATSKIKTGEDLNSINSLGFRGEALAAVSSVARVEMLTATGLSISGTHYAIEGGEEISYEESGCPKGTTVIIRDIFYNTPARMKFLKKDVSEANACAAVVERIALSHPEIAFKLIRDGKQTLVTTGDGNVKSAVYSVLGREFSSSLIEVSSAEASITVGGLICKPTACKPTRNSQFTFLNGRLVRSGTVVAAVEQAYKNSAMIGKFPAFVLYITIPSDTVDVNVHPAKTEVRFSDERTVFNGVYAGVKNALALWDTRPEVKLTSPAFNKFQHMTTEQYRQQSIPAERTVAEAIYKKDIPKKDYSRLTFKASTPDFANNYSVVLPDGSESRSMNASERRDFEEKANNRIKDDTLGESTLREQKSVDEAQKPSLEDLIDQENEIKVIGEAFSTYIAVQMKDSLYLIDKHAAHERILFNELNRSEIIESQALLTAATVTLVREEYDAVIGNLELFLNAGFEIDDFGGSTVAVRTVPSYLIGENISSVISEASQGLLNGTGVNSSRREELLHRIACRAAVKAGNKLSVTEMENLAKKVLFNRDVMYCPHGRPVAFEIKKRELEKQFGRIQ